MPLPVQCLFCRKSLQGSDAVDTPLRACGFKGFKRCRRFKGLWWAPFRKKGRQYENRTIALVGEGKAFPLWWRSIKRGAFPRAKRGCLVFAAARQHTYSSPLGDTFPSEPYEPSEPFEPCHAVAPWAIPQPSAAARLSNLRTLRPPGRSILRTFSIIQWKNIKNFEPYWIFVKNFV